MCTSFVSLSSSSSSSFRVQKMSAKCDGWANKTRKLHRSLDRTHTHTHKIGAFNANTSDSMLTTKHKTASAHCDSL